METGEGRAFPAGWDDRLSHLDVQCGWLCEVGFEEVDCYLKIHEFAVFGGRRRGEGWGKTWIWRDAETRLHDWPCLSFAGYFAFSGNRLFVFTCI